MTAFRTLFQILVVSIVAATANLFGATIQVFNDNMAGTINWYKTNEYVLNGFVFVETNEVLNIEAGTVIRGQPGGSSTNVSALVIARGGRIFAQGTAEEPIIFTALSDNLNNPNDLLRDDRGLWGGVAILGNAVINSSKNAAGSQVTPQYDIMEGLPNLLSLHYGGDNDNDNSGVFRYVSIRHAGTIFEVNREMNGLTLCAVGRGTAIDHVEVFANADDGVEFFGGAVNTHHIVAAFCDDDAFDTDQGYRGTNQFWFAIQGPSGNRNFGGEYAGDPVSPFNRLPLSSFSVYNATYIGAGTTNVTGVANHTIDAKEDTAAKHYNTIFTDFADRGIRIQNSATNRLNAGDLDFRNNIWFGFRSGDTVANINVLNAAVLFTDTTRSNLIVDPMLRGISRDPNAGLDPRPSAGSPVLSGNHRAVPANLTAVNYIGAFAPDGLWTAEWTALDQLGYTPAVVPPGPQQIQVFNSSITGTVNWYKTNEYVLNGFVFVETNEVLNIEAGTVIRGQPGGSSTNVSALVIARGGRIFAQGTAEEPIIFTALSDNLNNPNDLLRDDRGLWGGVAILGNAVINSSKNAAGSQVTPQYDIMEGLPNLLSLHYGGDNDNDNSGVFRYVSIRHAGTVFEVNREMNGLTLCAVGRGTAIDHVEVFANADDGVEFFGGAVNTHHIVAAFCDDDAFDTDQGYRGTNQFWFAIQAPGGNRNFGGEYAGDPVSPFNRLPLSSFSVYNATYIGAGTTNVTGVANHAIDAKEDTAAKHYNTIFTDFADRGIRIQNSATNRLNAGDLDFRNNIWFGFRSGDTVANINVLNAAVLFTDTTRSNLIVDPMLRGISRDPNAGLDPRPSAGSPVLSGNHRAVPANLTAVNYIGAFAPDGLWTAEWTALDRLGYTPSVIPSCPTPALTIVRNANNVEISFSSQSGCNYQLQSTDSLLGSWTDDGSSVVGTGSGLTLGRAVSGTGIGIRFFRVVTQ